MKDFAGQAIAAGAKKTHARAAAQLAGARARIWAMYTGKAPEEWFDRYFGGIEAGEGESGDGALSQAAAMRRSGAASFALFHANALNQSNTKAEFWDYGDSALLGLPVKVGEDRIRKTVTRHPDVTLSDWENLPKIIEAATDIAKLRKYRQWPDTSNALVAKFGGETWVILGAPRKKHGGYFEVLSLFKDDPASIQSWLKQAAKNMRSLTGVGGYPNAAQARGANTPGRTGPSGSSKNRITGLFANYKKPVKTLPQSAFHGSPFRRIEEFLLKHIGTGEGNQAYGWGSYLAGIIEAQGLIPGNPHALSTEMRCKISMRSQPGFKARPGK